MDEKSLLDQARQITDPDERARWLQNACGNDSALRQRIDALLQSEVQRTSDSRPALAADDLPPTIDLAVETHDDELGKTVGPAAQTATNLAAISQQYEVLEELGRGGMGVVLKAYDHKLQRFAAIKILAPILAADEEARQRFLREARSAAAVNHPNVVTIFAIDDQRAPYLIMEYIAGQTLAQRLKQQPPLSVPEIVRIAMQVADGLAAAHGQGLIHRDIKPGNILLDEKTGNVKITDFGLARASNALDLTQSGYITGTPLFMSPEQAAGNELDARSDLFSLGSVIYTLCTGQTPFAAPTMMAVLRKVCDETPPSILAARPDTPRWLVDLVQNLLAKQPSARIQSAIEVQARLKEGLALGNQPTLPAAALAQSGTAAAPKGPNIYLLAAVGALLVVAAVGWKYFPRKVAAPVADADIVPEGRIQNIQKLAEITIPDLPAMQDEDYRADLMAAATFLQREGDISILRDDDKHQIGIRCYSLAELPDTKWRVNAIQLGGATVADLQTLLPLRHLVQLEMSHSTIPASVVLDHIEHLPGFRILGMNYAGLTRDDLPKLLQFPRLYLLNAYAAQWTDEDIAVLVQLKSLRSLNLGGTRITDTALEYLAELPELEKLGVSGTDVTDDGLRHLQRCSTLTALDVTQTLVTPIGVARFREAKPRCELRAP